MGSGISGMGWARESEGWHGIENKGIGWDLESEGWDRVLVKWNRFRT